MSGDLIKAELRDGTLYCSNGADKFMKSIFQEYLERGIKTYLRGDSGFASPKLYETCESNGCSYAIRLKQNPALIALDSDKDEALYKAPQKAQIRYAVTYGEFMYQAGSWNYPRRVVFKIEKPYGQLTHIYTFIVTNMDMEPYQVIQFYCGRGKMENFIKEGKSGFDFAAVSSHSKVVNANRMVADEVPEVIEGETSESVNTESGKSQLPVLFTRIRDILTRIIGLPGALWRKITSFIKGILGKIRHIRNTIAGIRSKLDWWKEFLGNEKTKAAIALVWKDAKGLIHHVLPTKVEGQVTFGCDDPSITGTVLAVLGMTFPFHQNRIQVTPLFDGENQLTGNISLKGRIYGIMFVKAALEIYINKNVKYVINRWKHKED